MCEQTPRIELPQDMSWMNSIEKNDQDTDPFIELRSLVKLKNPCNWLI